MDSAKVKVPYLASQIIRRKADLFRRRFWDNSLPVDIERIIDQKLKIDIIPLPNLFRSCGMDALILSDWRSICVDKNEYLHSRYQNRLRFSLAHEIGHLVLHKKIWEKLGIRSSVDFYWTILQIPPEQYGFMETQANKFAGFLLVAQGRLLVEREKALNKFKKTGLDEKFLDSFVVRSLSNTFGVSEETIKIRLGNF